MKRVCGDCIIAIVEGEQSETIPALYECEFCGGAICAKHAVIEEYRPYCNGCLDYWEDVAKQYAPAGALVE